MIPSCCLDPVDNKLRKKIPPIEPPRPTTHHSNPNCYLRGTNDCSNEISREHYISATLLKQLGEDAVEVSGMPWLKPGESKNLSIKNLTSKVLCKRHNESLSPLDQEAGKFFQAIKSALSKLQRKSSSKRTDFYLASGTALELWMLKTACGLFFSRTAANNRDRLADGHSIDMEKVRRAFFKGVWDDDRTGLFLNGGPDSIFTINEGLQISPLSRDNIFGGILVAMHGIQFFFVFDTLKHIPGDWSRLTRRPSDLIFERNGRKQHLMLTWPVGVPEMYITIDDGA